MKTTLDLDDSLLTEAKTVAAQRQGTLKSLVEEALRAHLTPRPVTGQSFRLDVPIVTGTAPPAVDIADRRVLMDFLDDSLHSAKSS